MSFIYQYLWAQLNGQVVNKLTIAALLSVVADKAFCREAMSNYNMTLIVDIQPGLHGKRQCAS